jgi:hypothetical protein
MSRPEQLVRIMDATSRTVEIAAVLVCGANAALIAGAVLA